MANGASNPDLDVVTAAPAVFHARDRSDSRFFIFATLASGVLRFEVVTQIPTGEQSAVRGREFFNAMLSHFGARVKTIEARWSQATGLTTNLNHFNQATAAGLSVQQSALLTKTGRWADD